MPPAIARWLSLTRTASSRPRRWLCAPPARTAYFSRTRSVGVVLRVSRMTARVPAISSTALRESVAIPERRWRKLRATRSAVRMAAACPSTRASVLPIDAGPPSSTSSSNRMLASSCVKVSRASGSPHTRRASRATIRPRADAPVGTTAVVVMSPAPTSSRSAAATNRLTTSAGRGSIMRGSPAGGPGARLSPQTGEDLVDAPELLGELRVDAPLLVDDGDRGALEKGPIRELARARADLLLEPLALLVETPRFGLDVEQALEGDRDVEAVRHAAGRGSAGSRSAGRGSPGENGDVPAAGQGRESAAVSLDDARVAPAVRRHDEPDA